MSSDASGGATPPGGSRLPSSSHSLPRRQPPQYAPLRVTGSGLYCGGCLRGREWLELGSLDAADGVHGDVWPQAGLHALGGVWSAGEEIHAGPEAGAEYPYDTDMHTGDNEVSRFVAPPEASLLIALRDAAVAPGAALHDGVLDLARLPLSRPLGSGAGSGEDGYVVVATAAEGAELRLVGARPPGACPIVLVVQGAAALGEPGVPTAFGGALLVLGSLRVCGPSALSGHPVSYTHLRAHETGRNLVCRLLLEK